MTLTREKKIWGMQEDYGLLPCIERGFVLFLCGGQRLGLGGCARSVRLKTPVQKRNLKRNKALEDFTIPMKFLLSRNKKKSMIKISF